MMGSSEQLPVVYILVEEIDTREVIIRWMPACPSNWQAKIGKKRSFCMARLVTIELILKDSSYFMWRLALTSKWQDSDNEYIRRVPLIRSCIYIYVYMVPWRALIISINIYIHINLDIYIYYNAYLLFVSIPFLFWSFHGYSGELEQSIMIWLWSFSLNKCRRERRSTLARRYHMAEVTLLAGSITTFGLPVGLFRLKMEEEGGPLSNQSKGKRICNSVS